MKHARAWSVALAAAALAASIAVAADGRPDATPQQSDSAASDPAAPVFTRVCALCHEAARITAIRRTSTEWEEQINKMIERGAQVSDQDFETIHEYLRRHYGKVHINTAPADEIETILALSKKEAEAIVAYRKANGPFKDVAALKKVPDVDGKKLDDRKDAIVF